MTTCIAGAPQGCDRALLRDVEMAAKSMSMVDGGSGIDMRDLTEGLRSLFGVDPAPKRTGRVRSRR